MSLLSCKKFTQLSSRSMEKPLSIVEWLQYRFHFCLCFTCRRFERQIHTIQKVLSIAAERDERFEKAGESCSPGLSAEAKERMKSCFHQDRR